MSINVAKPIIRKIEDTQEALVFFESVTLPAEDEKTQEIITNFPTVYIHNWQDTGDYEVYVGETNDIFRRTREHYGAASDKNAWQSKLAEKDASLFIIGHEHFNKSLTLADVMVYCQNLVDKLGFDADEIINMKMEQNEAKYPVEKAKGSSAKYTDLK